jgi:hypothetical protein
MLNRIYRRGTSGFLLSVSESSETDYSSRIETLGEKNS